MSRTLSAQRVAQLAAEIRHSGEIARTRDPRALFSYAAMCGGLECILLSLVRDLAGEPAAAQIKGAFADAYTPRQGATDRSGV